MWARKSHILVEECRNVYTIQYNTADRLRPCCVSLLRCPSADDIKYRMFRFSLDALDLHLVECDTSLNLLVRAGAVGL